MRKLLLLTLVAFATPFPSKADNKVPISITVQSANDQIVERVAYEFKEAIRRSASMRLVQPGREVLIHLMLVAVPPVPNSYASYSITWILRGPEKGLNYYITSSAATCGTMKVKECAESLVAATDVEATNWGWANSPLK